MNMSNAQIGIFTLLLIVFLIWIFAGGRPFFRNSRNDIRSTLDDAGHDLKSTGRDAADSIRDAVK
jgi:uncharacterized membrane protein